MVTANMRSRLASAATILMAAAFTALGQDLPLKVEITTPQTTIQNNHDFMVDTAVRNTSKEEQILQTTMCYYGDWNWRTDNLAVHVEETRRTVPCEKNPFVYVELKPGDVFKIALSVRVSISAREAITETVTFRLGLKPRLGYGLPTLPLSYIWSNPVTIRIGQ
jgi:hypothetical protein